MCNECRSEEIKRPTTARKFAFARPGRSAGAVINLRGDTRRGIRLRARRQTILISRAETRGTTRRDKYTRCENTSDA